MATTDERPPWALPSGLPTAHLIRAALRAGSLLDAYGSPVPAARTAYILYPSDALYPPEDLRLGESLLVDCGLVSELDGYLHPTPELQELLTLLEDEAVAVILERVVLTGSSGGSDSSACLGVVAEATVLLEALVPDADRREALLIALGRQYDEASRTALGTLGEEHVAVCAREELLQLGHPALAEGVCRLAAIVDNLGYDVVAPRPGGKRRLEVKTTRRPDDGLTRFFITRAEIDWGQRDTDWALVVCRALPDGGIHLAGWCRAGALEPYLPIDGEGARWVTAELIVPASVLERGLPPAD